MLSRYNARLYSKLRSRFTTLCISKSSQIAIEVVSLAIHFNAYRTASWSHEGPIEPQRAKARPRKPVTIEGQVQSVTRTQKPAATFETFNKSSKAAYSLRQAPPEPHTAQLFEDNALQSARSGAGVFTRVANYASEPIETRGALIDTFA